MEGNEKGDEELRGGSKKEEGLVRDVWWRVKREDGLGVRYRRGG